MRKRLPSIRVAYIALPILLLIFAAVVWTQTHPAQTAFDVPLSGPPPPLYARVAPSGISNIRLVDIAASAGLDYSWTITGPRPCDILQTIGNGCVFLDFNNDGNLDILLVGSSLALYQGDGKGRFVDQSKSVGLDRYGGHFLGCCVGDYDNDGYDDVYISAYRGGLLLRNDAGNRFVDVTARAGIDAQRWGTSCAFGDIDNDGRLDLFVGNYLKFDPAQSNRLCVNNGVKTSCGPSRYEPEYGYLYHNDGNSRFHDITSTWIATSWGKILGVAFADYDASARQSLYLANDGRAGELLQNARSTFTDVGSKSGTAYDSRGATHAGMGVDWGDYDNDGKLDLCVATFRNEPKCIYHNSGYRLFEERGSQLGIDDWTLPFVAFGVKWIDLDNDGWLDLMITNGHVQDNIRDVDPSASFKQPMQVFRNDGGRKLGNISGMTGDAVMTPIVGRGLAAGDFDNDGRVDALAVNSAGQPLLLHNETRGAGHWIGVRLVGVSSNRDGYGATVTVTAGGLTKTRVCHADGSYLSSSDKRVVAGLGAATRVDRLQVRWPSGQTDTYHNVAADRYITIREGVQQITTGQ